MSGLNNTGQIIILFFCCVWPFIGAVIGIAAYRRYVRRGLTGFIPKIRTGGYER